MARVRISTTVDEGLLAEARRLVGDRRDAALIDEALRSLVRRYRDAEIDAAYAVAYADHPDDEPDAWGDLASWGDAVRQAR